MLRRALSPGPPLHALPFPPLALTLQPSPPAASSTSSVHVVFQVGACLACLRFRLTLWQGIGDKLRIVALSHTQQQQQQRAASYHSNGNGISAEHVPVMMPPQSMSWGGAGDVHEC
jgi:hypothetical protein